MFVPDFGSRLRETREKLGLSQQQMADLCGVGMRSQRNYEKGARSPDSEYMAALTAQGVDVSYLLTGIGESDLQKINYDLQRAQEEIRGTGSIAESSATYSFSSEQALLEWFRRSTDVGKEAILATAKAVEKIKGDEK
jgi:transcriptional regulator with XRE-family HTH domain